MFKYKVVPLLMVLLSIQRVNSQKLIDKVFLKWNEVTFRAMQSELVQATDSSEKKFYLGRTENVMGYWDVKNLNTINRSSIRYRFLKMISDSLLIKTSPIYVIEANKSGSKVAVRNFLITLDKNGKTRVDLFQYFIEGWRFMGHFWADSIDFRSDMGRNRVAYNKGFNYDDIAITLFFDQEVIRSDYYLFTTLSKESSIKTLLESYENKLIIVEDK